MTLKQRASLKKNYVSPIDRNIFNDFDDKGIKARAGVSSWEPDETDYPNRSETSSASLTDGNDVDFGERLNEQLKLFDKAIYGEVGLGGTTGLPEPLLKESKLWYNHSPQLRILGEKLNPGRAPVITVPDEGEEETIVEHTTGGGRCDGEMDKAREDLREGVKREVLERLFGLVWPEVLERARPAIKLLASSRRPQEQRPPPPQQQEVVVPLPTTRRSKSSLPPGNRLGPAIRAVIHDQPVMRLESEDRFNQSKSRLRPNILPPIANHQISSPKSVKQRSISAVYRLANESVRQFPSRHRLQPSIPCRKKELLIQDTAKWELSPLTVLEINQKKKKSACTVPWK